MSVDRSANADVDAKKSEGRGGLRLAFKAIRMCRASRCRRVREGIESAYVRDVRKQIASDAHLRYSHAAVITGAYANSVESEYSAPTG